MWWDFKDHNNPNNITKATEISSLANDSQSLLWHSDDVLDFQAFLIETYGTDRLVLGSPRQQQSAETRIENEQLREFLQGLSLPDTSPLPYFEQPSSNDDSDHNSDLHTDDTNNTEEYDVAGPDPMLHGDQQAMMASVQSDPDVQNIPTEQQVPQNVTINDPIEVETVESSEATNFLDTTNVTPISLFPQNFDHLEEPNLNNSMTQQAANVWANTTYNTQISNLINEAVRHAVEQALMTPATQRSYREALTTSPSSLLPAPTINMPNLTVTIPDPAANKTASLRLSLLSSAKKVKLLMLHYKKNPLQMRQVFNYWFDDVCELLSAHQETEPLIGLHNKIIPFQNSDCPANKAVFSLLKVYCDNHFRVTLNNTPSLGDQALINLQKECASINEEDKNYFTRQLLLTEMYPNENVRSYITRFNRAVSSAKEAQVFHDDHYLANMFISGMAKSGSLTYQSLRNAIKQTLLRVPDSTNLITIQNDFLQLDESAMRSYPSNQRANMAFLNRNPMTRIKRKGQTNSNLSSPNNNPRFKGKCYNCGQEGHIAPNCPLPRKPRNNNFTNIRNNRPNNFRPRSIPKFKKQFPSNRPTVNVIASIDKDSEVSKS